MNKKMSIPVLISLFALLFIIFTGCEAKMNWYINKLKTAYWFNRANGLHIMGKYKEAVEAYNKAIELEPENPNLWYNKAQSQEKLGGWYEKQEKKVNIRGVYTTRALNSLRTARRLAEKQGKRNLMQKIDLMITELEK